MFKEGEAMSRMDLQPFRNKTVNVVGRVENIAIKRRLKYTNAPNPATMLLKEVVIAGYHFDHIWIKLPKKYYLDRERLLNREVQFKGKVKLYVKEGQYGFVEDYGIDDIQGLSTLIREDVPTYNGKAQEQEFSMEFFLRLFEERPSET